MPDSYLGQLTAQMGVTDELRRTDLAWPGLTRLKGDTITMRVRWHRFAVLTAVVALLGAVPVASYASTYRPLSFYPLLATTTSAVTPIHGTLTNTPVGSTVAIRQKAGSSWITVAYVKTTAGGVYARNVRMPAARGIYYYDAYAAPIPNRSAAVSATRAIVVRTPVNATLGSSMSTPPAGSSISLAGAVYPWVPGTSVSLEHQVGSATSWAALTPVTPNSSGRYSLNTTPTPDSVNRYRVVAAMRGNYTGAVSPSIAVTPQTIAAPPPPDTTPPPPVTGLTLTPNPANQYPSIVLTWSNPASTDYTGVIIRRTMGTTPPQSPTDGTAVADVAAPGTGFGDGGVQEATTYSYSLFAHDAAGNDAPAVTATTTTPVTDMTPPANATGVTATPVENGITLAWTDPADTDFAKVVIQRSVQMAATPISTSWEQDSTVATIDGRATTTYTDTSAVAGVSYTYRVFAYDQAGNYRTDAQQVSAIAGCVGDPVRHVSGALASGLVIQWSPQCAGTYVIDAPGLTVPYPTTLTVAPGTVVKASAGSGLSVIGAMDAVGTPTVPITFTSTRDSSVGATIDSGNPAAGDWAGISVGTTWDPYTHTGPLSGLDLEYANVDYGTSPITALNSNTTVAHSSIENGINEGIAVQSSWSPPVVEDDTITDTATKPSQAAVYINDNFDPNTVGGLSGSGNGLNATVLNGGATVRQPDPVTPVLTSSASWPIIIGYDMPCSYPHPTTSACGAGLGSDPNAPLTIAPGSVIKFAAGSMLDGPIVAQGTAQAPITITSINDNSIGGNTGSGSPQPGDWYGITINDGSVLTPTIFDHTTIKYSRFGITDGSGGLTVTNSTIGSTLTSGITVALGGTSAPVVIENNVINDSALTPDDNPAVFGSAAISLTSGSLDLDQIYGNTGTGDGHPGTYVSGTASGTVQTDPSWPLVIGTDLKCVRTYTTPCGGNEGLYVPGQLTIQPGSLVEFMYGANLRVDGQLTAQGTSSAPIVFTSVNDSGAGTPPTTMSPQAGDWYGLQVNGSAAINYATIKYAKRALDFSGQPAQASVQHTWFDNNTTSLYSTSFAGLPSSTCGIPSPYIASGNTFGDSKSTNPFVTASDYSSIQSALSQGATTTPSGWTNHVSTGTTDLLQWSTFTCASAPNPILATPWQTY